MAGAPVKDGWLLVNKGKIERVGARFPWIVYEEEGGRTAVVAVDPLQTMASHGHPVLRELAATVKAKLEKALAQLN